MAIEQSDSFREGFRPPCSIVIRSFNEQEHIGRLLSGIFQQTLSDPEVILVDSGSTDATLNIASRYPLKIVSIEPEEFSFGRSLNRGCMLARSEHIVICSAHVYPVYKDWLARLLGPFCDPEVALTYGKQRGNEVTRYSEHQLFTQWFPSDSATHRASFFCNNANAAIRRDLWKQIPYDEDLTGLEDLDWAKRATARGFKIAYVSEAEIVHVHKETPRRIYNRYRREALALKRIAPEERFGFADFVRLLFTNVASDCFHAWHDRVFLRNLFSIPTFRAAQFWGGYRGFSRADPVTSELKRTFYYPRGLERSPQVTLESSRALVDYGGATFGERHPGVPQADVQPVSRSHHDDELTVKSADHF